MPKWPYISSTIGQTFAGSCTLSEYFPSSCYWMGVNTTLGNTMMMMMLMMMMLCWQWQTTYSIIQGGNTIQYNTIQYNSCLHCAPTSRPRAHNAVQELLFSDTPYDKVKRNVFSLRSWSTVSTLSVADSILEAQRQKNARSPIFTARRCASAVYAVVVCPSVRQSVRPPVTLTGRYYTKMAKPRITQATPYDSPGTLVFRCQKSRRNSNGVTPNGGAK